MARTGFSFGYDSPQEDCSFAPVAQLDRVPGFEPGGREFESLRARHINKKVTFVGQKNEKT